MSAGGRVVEQRAEPPQQLLLLTKNSCDKNKYDDSYDDYLHIKCHFK